jgi:epoxyqueuosine reductase
MTLSEFASMDEETFAQKTQGTPLSRARRGGLARNAALVATNRLKREPRHPLADDWRRTIEVAAEHEDPAAREVGRAGLERIGHARSAVDPGEDELPAGAVEIQVTGDPEAAILREKSAANEASAHEHDQRVSLRVKRAPE